MPDLDDDFLFAAAAADPAAVIGDIRQALVALVTTNATLSALIAGRIFAGYLPQGSSFPQVCFRLQSRTRVESLDGPVGQSFSTFAFSCFAGDPATLASIVKALAHLFDGRRYTVGQVQILGATIPEESDELVRGDGNADGGLNFDSLAIRFQHTYAP